MIIEVLEARIRKRKPKRLSEWCDSSYLV